jgi:hypothetical protein
MVHLSVWAHPYGALYQVPILIFHPQNLALEVWTRTKHHTANRPKAENINLV